MPSATAVEQLGTVLRAPSTSTMQMRQAADGRQARLVAQRGDVDADALRRPRGWSRRGRRSTSLAVDGERDLGARAAARRARRAACRAVSPIAVTLRCLPCVGRLGPLDARPHLDGVELADLAAGVALDAEVLVDHVELLLLAGDGAGRALLGAQPAAGAVAADVVGDERLAAAGRAALLVDVRLVLVAEVPERGEHRVGRRAAEGAQRALDDVVGRAPRAARCRPARPSPAVMRSSISSMRLVPRRQGTHLPQLSSWVNCRKNLAKSTMQVVSSTTTMPPEPIDGAGRRRGSRSRPACRAGSAGRQPPEGPPSCTALNSRPGSMPPPTSKMTWRRVAPMGTSTRPPLSILPARLKILVPLRGLGAHGGDRRRRRGR